MEHLSEHLALPGPLSIECQGRDPGPTASPNQGKQIHPKSDEHSWGHNGKVSFKVEKNPGMSPQK